MHGMEHIKFNKISYLNLYNLCVSNIKKFRGLNLPDPHGPVQACSGTALLYFYLL
jgi:hypothetical protein